MCEEVTYDINSDCEYDSSPFSVHQARRGYCPFFASDIDHISRFTRFSSFSERYWKNKGKAMD
jgi:hypothetical protein